MIFVFFIFLNTGIVLKALFIGKLYVNFLVNSKSKSFSKYLYFDNSSSQFDFNGERYPFTFTSDVDNSKIIGIDVTALQVTISNFSLFH